MSSLHFEEAATDIRQRWQSLPHHLPFLIKLKKVSRFYRKFCIQRAFHYRAEEQTLGSELDKKLNDLQDFPQSVLLQDAVNALKAKLTDFEHRKLEEQKTRSRAR